MLVAAARLWELPRRRFHLVTCTSSDISRVHRNHQTKTLLQCQLSAAILQHWAALYLGSCGGRLAERCSCAGGAPGRPGSPTGSGSSCPSSETSGTACSPGQRSCLGCCGVIRKCADLTCLGLGRARGAGAGGLGAGGGGAGGRAAVPVPALYLTRRTCNVTRCNRARYAELLLIGSSCFFPSGDRTWLGPQSLLI